MRYRIIRYILLITSTFRNKLVMILNNIKFGKKFVSCGNIIFRRYSGNIVIGDNVNINSHRLSNPIGGDNITLFVTSDNGYIRIGDRVGISNSCFFSVCGITIEDDVCIGAGCKIYDTNFHSIYPEYRLNGNTEIRTSPILIRKKSFIGGHSIILKGVTIGEGAVVAAGSVVSKDIPDYEVWGGNPARFLKKIQ